MHVQGFGKGYPLGMGAGTASVCVGALSSAEAKTSLQEEEKSPWAPLTWSQLLSIFAGSEWEGVIYLS